MPAFEYTVIDHAGNRAAGSLEAESTDEAARKLQQDYATVISVRPVRHEETALADTFGARVSAYIDALRNRIPTRNVVFFTRQLATMFAAGMTVERALRTLAVHEKHQRFRGMLQRIGSDIQSGRTLSDALAQHPSAFGNLFVALVKAGETSGTLSEILERLAEHLERNEDVKRKVGSALTYPVVVLAILAACVYLLVVVVAPRFSRVYDSFGASLPVPTQILMSVSTFLVDNFVAGIFLVASCVVALVLFSLSDRGRNTLDFLKLKTPVVGTLIGNSIMARFARTLGLLMSTSVPVLDALTLVSRVVHNVIVQRAVLAAREGIQDGRSMSGSLERTGAFTDILTQLVATGEETGEIDSLLIKSAEYYEKQVDALIGRMTSLIEPLLIVLLGVVVGTLVVIIYLPIFYLGAAMKKGLG